MEKFPENEPNKEEIAKLHDIDRDSIIHLLEDMSDEELVEFYSRKYDDTFEEDESVEREVDDKGLTRMMQALLKQLEEAENPTDVQRRYIEILKGRLNL